MWKWFHQLASPPHFYRIAPIFSAVLLLPGLALIAYGVYSGLFLAPMDYQQGDAFRIIYIHVPSAYLSMMAYMIMAVAGGIGLIWRMKLAHAVAASAAPLGAWFTFLALATGSIWGASRSAASFWANCVDLSMTPTYTSDMGDTRFLGSFGLKSTDIGSARS